MQVQVALACTTLFAVFIHCVEASLYITVPNPFTDSGRGCRVYILVDKKGLLLREVPWECSTVFGEAQFWREGNITELEYAKKRERMPRIPPWLSSQCGTPSSKRTFAVHDRVAVCLFLNDEGSVSLSWSSLEVLNDDSQRGTIHLSWHEFLLNNNPEDEIFLGSHFDGDALFIVATNVYNNHLLIAELYADDILRGHESLLVSRQIVTEVPRLVPETYRAWVTGPCMHTPETGYCRPGAYLVNISTHSSSTDPDQSVSGLPKSLPLYGGEGEQTVQCIGAECDVGVDAMSGDDELQKRNSHGNEAEQNVVDFTVDAAFGSGSGGYEPDELAKYVKSFKKELEVGFRLFKQNRFAEAKEIYVHIMEEMQNQPFNVVTAPSTQAARFNLGSICYRLEDYEDSAKYLEQLISGHATMLQLDANGQLGSGSGHQSFQYMNLAYNLLADVLFLNHVDIPRALKIWKLARKTHKADLEMQAHLHQIIAKWTQFWQLEMAQNMNHFDTVMSTGLLLYDQDNWGEARKVLQRAHKLSPKHKVPMVYFRMAMLDVHDKKYDSAGRNLLKYTQLRIKDYDGWLWRGRVAKYAGKHSHAIKYFTKANALEPTKYEAYADIINMLRSEHAEDRYKHIATKFLNKAISLGLLVHSDQVPSHFVRGIPSMPWHNPAVLTEKGSIAVTVLESNFHRIQKEVLEAYEKGIILREGIDDTEGLTTQGRWTELNLYFHGKKFEKNCNLLPITTSILESIPEIVSHVKGATKISVLQPGTTIRTHHGPTNTRIRLHLGLKVSNGATITVGNITRTWEEGKVLAFDDSYLHSVSHLGKSPRVALIADVWPPDMTDADRINCMENAEEVERYKYRMGLFQDSDDE